MVVAIYSFSGTSDPFGVFSLMPKALTSYAQSVSYYQDQNSQTMPLLKASDSTSVLPTGGADIIITDDNSLVSENSSSDNIAKKDVDSRTPQASIYVVRDGDTVSQIAEKFNVSMDTILWTNNIQSKNIHLGQNLIVLPVSGVRHTVASGDTLSQIAEEYDASEDKIISFNHLSDTNNLHIGDKLVIPGGKMTSSKKTTSKTSSSKTGSSHLTEPIHSVGKQINTDGYFIFPLHTGVVTQSIHGYNAVDIGAPVGTSVLAAAAGNVTTVEQGGWDGGYGNYAVLSHNNGTQTLYAHMSKVIISAGQHVVQGQVIGYVGMTGKTTGPHVHFEVRSGVNPFKSCKVGSRCGT